jgi:hypothetical protein
LSGFAIAQIFPARKTSKFELILARENGALGRSEKINYYSVLCLDNFFNLVVFGPMSSLLWLTKALRSTLKIFDDGDYCMG